jgi:hypothetical protein
MNVFLIIVPLIFIIIIGVILYPTLNSKSKDEVITQESITEESITEESITEESITEETPEPTIVPIPSVDCVLSEWSVCDTTGKQTRTITTPASGTGLVCGNLTQSCTTPANALSCEEAKKEYLKDNVDVKNSGMDAWEHYTNYGKSENRKWKGSECKSLPTLSVPTIYKDLTNNTLNPGQAVQCNGTDTLVGAGAVYRFDGTNKLRHYPSPTIAGSWDGNWRARVRIDCTPFSKGDTMAFNLDKLNPGQAVQCNGTDTIGAPGSVYRYDGTNKLRYYPSPGIAGSWDGNWRSRVSIDCNTFTRGDDMTAKVI